MCGIHGVVTSKKREPNADDFIKQGFIAGSLRGTDSSGMASINVLKMDTAWQKLPVNGTFFVTDKLTHRLAVDGCAPGTISLCHTRSATSGPVGINEAHPFCVSGEDNRELIGVHNGSLNGWQSKVGASAYKVDSEWALNHIFDNGIKAFEDFTGAFVFAWWDSNDSEVFNIALNDSRPLFVAFTTNGNMLFASESGMIYWLAERNNIKLEGKVRKLLSNFWYRFNIQDLIDYTKEALPVKVVTTYHNNTTTTHINHMDSVVKLLDLIADKTSSQADPTVVSTVPTVATVEKPTKRTGVTPKEVLAAKEAGMMNTVGEFHPLWLDDDTAETWGTFVDLDTGMELDAIMRNASHLKFETMKDVWNVKVIGIKDDLATITCVCTHPLDISAYEAA